METVIEPGTETFDHSHSIEAAYFVQTDSKLRITYDDQSTAEAILKRGDVGFGDSAVVHRVANIGDTTARVITVEIFSQPPRQTSDEPPSSVGEILIDNDKVVVARVRVPQGHVLALPNGHQSVIVPALGGSLKSGNRTISVEQGEPYWHRADAPELYNVNGTPFEAYIVVIKPRT